MKSQPFLSLSQAFLEISGTFTNHCYKGKKTNGGKSGCLNPETRQLKTPTKETPMDDSGDDEDFEPKKKVNL